MNILYHCFLLLLVAVLSFGDRSAEAQPNDIEAAEYRYTCPSALGRFANPYDCSEFWDCHTKDQLPTRHTCNPGYLYDEVRKQCLQKEYVTCGKRPGGNKFVCPYQNGRFPNPNACSQYYECTNNVPKLFTCFPFDLYDINQKRCVDYRQVNCGNRPGGGKEYRYACPSAFGRFANPYDCSEFWDCHTKDQLPTRHTCNPGYLYDEVRKQCLQKEYVTCGKRPGGNKFVCPYQNGRFPNPNACSQYYECTNNVITLFTCLPFDLYDINQKRCVDFRQVNCGNRPGGGKDYRYICPSAFGRFEDPSDCSQFYDCHTKDQEPTLHKCGPSTLFSVKSKQCMQASLVNCGNRPLGIGDRNKFVCPYPNGRFPNPNACSQYYECTNNVPKLFTCFPFDLYDINQQRCVDYRQVNCGNRPGGGKEYRETCPSAFGRFANPYDCSEFFDCHTKDQLPTRHKCNKGTLYDEERKQCIQDTLVNCGKRPGGITDMTTTTTTTTPVPTTTTTTPVPTTTTTTPVPTTTTTTPMPTTTTTTTPVPTTTTTTPKPTTTSTTTTTVAPTTVSNKKPNTPPPTDCDDEDIDCIEDKTKDDITGWFECPAQYGHFPHTGHIQLFIHCDNWHPFIKRCGPRTRFSPTNLVCVHM